MDARELRDRAEIHDLMMRYARGIDRRDWDLVAACFTPGADVDYGDWIFKGAIEDAIALFRTGLARWAMTMHFMANQLIEVRGDQAHVETYCVAYHRMTAEGPPFDMQMGLRYHDDLVRGPDGWRIRRRVLEHAWRRKDAVVLPAGG